MREKSPDSYPLFYTRDMPKPTASNPSIMRGIIGLTAGHKFVGPAAKSTTLLTAKIPSEVTHIARFAFRARFH